MELALKITMGIVIICTYVSYMPQIVKIIRTKKADDLSITSWLLWTVSGANALIYSLLLKRNEMIVETLSETILIAITFILSIRYTTSNKNKIDLCDVKIDTDGQEWYILSKIIDSMDTTEETLSIIARDCTVPSVLAHIVVSSNPNLTEDIRNLASSRYTKLIANGSNEKSSLEEQ